MFRRFISLSAGVLTLLCVIGMPGQLYAQHGRGSFRPMVRPQVGRFSNSFDRRFMNSRNGFRSSFDRRFMNSRNGFRSSFDRRFTNSRFNGFRSSFDRRFTNSRLHTFNPIIDRRFIFDPRFR
jgi:hypothetical protein